MWRTTTVTLVAAVLLALTAAAALAATINPINCPHYEDTSDRYDCEGTPDADTINGTSGLDYMAGFAGKDTLNGKAGDDKIDALEGEDIVSGGLGNDTIAANDGLKDDIDCGPGSRDIVYSDKGTDSVSNCEWRRSYNTAEYCPGNGIPWTGATEPNDFPDPPVPWVAVRDKTIWCIDGTLRDDKKLHGTTGYSDLLDSIWGDKGDDKLNGGVGPDSLQGWSGNDILKGGAGPDFLYGDSSANPWIDGFFKKAGQDKIYGGPGNDYIGAIDNKEDTISCGPGEDFVQQDMRGYDSGNDPPGISTVTDKVGKDCEEVMYHGEHSSFFCRIFGQRKRR
jgi:Ca2+-binding RTX toxin-like protein